MGVKDKLMSIFSKSLYEALIEDEPVAAVAVADKAATDPEPEKKEPAEPDLTTAEPDIAARVRAMEIGIEAIARAVSKIVEMVPEPAAETEAVAATADANCACTDGDTIARAEILAPGIAKVGDVKTAALKTAYGTEDGKSAIDLLLGGRAFDAADTETMFIAASELLKFARAGRINNVATLDNMHKRRGPLTPEEINELNAKHYGAK